MSCRISGPLEREYLFKRYRNALTNQVVMINYLQGINNRPEF